MVNEDCRWVWAPFQRTGEPGYVLFRRDFELKEGGRLHGVCSGDNRYILYLDGKMVSRGPVRGDLENYFYDTVTADLSAGRHTLAVEIVVWGQNHRTDPAPWSEIHDGGGWLFSGGVNEMDLSTPTQWICRRDDSRKFRPWTEATCSGREFPVPPMEEVNFRHDLRYWQTAPVEPEKWSEAVAIGNVYLRDTLSCDNTTRWRLIPRTIPRLTESAHTGAVLVREENAPQVLCGSDGVFRGTLPAGRGKFLIRLGEYFTGFCKLRLNAAGAGRVDIEWSEALFFGRRKGQRDDMSGQLEGRGLSDRLDFDAGEWEWSPFTWRSGCFVQVSFDLQEAVSGFELSFSNHHYPFEKKSRINVPEMPEINEIERICWNTVLSCAHEHYEDCPFYEQMQYAGDTRIQALISYRITGDDRLARQALYQFAQSKKMNGLTASRYPTNWIQYIPGFSLIWVLMVFDHYQYYGDREVVCDLLSDIRQVMDYFRRRMLPDGVIGNAGQWDVTDWVIQWSPPSGYIDRGTGKPAAIHSLLYSICCTKLAAFTGDKSLLAERDSIVEAVNRLFLDRELGVYRDVPDEKWYSQHTNAMALLADAVPEECREQVLHNLFCNKELAETSTYFKAYIFDVISHCHIDGRFIEELAMWRQILAWGFSSVPEVPRLISRSDCHAWGAGPIGYFVTILLGIQPMTPGFGKIAVSPLPGELNELSGEAPAGRGRMLAVSMKKVEGKWVMTLTITGGDGEIVPRFPGGEWGDTLHLQENIPVTIKDVLR